MRPLRSFFSRLQAPLLAGFQDADLSRELNTHIAMMTDENLRAGMSPEEARRQARLALGGIEQVKENCRDARTLGWIADFTQDLKHAFRTIRHKPGFAAVAIVMLALGIGATVVMFTLLDGVLLKPLPYPDPERIITLSEWTDKPTAYGNLWGFTYPNFEDTRRDSHALMLAASTYKSGTVAAAGNSAVPEHIDGAAISAGFFPVLGISAALRRAFTQSDDRPGAPPVVIVSHAFVTANYLDVMGIPLRAGRFFDTRDRPATELVVVIDDVLAQQAFHTANPQRAVGRQLWIHNMAPGPVRIAGVVGHVRHWGLAGDDQSPVRAQIYYPFSQLPDTLVHRWSDLMSIAVRTRVEPLSLFPALRRAAAGANSDQVLYQERTMDQLAAGSLARQRFLMLLFGIFAALALMLASIGIYGVLAYLTSQRTQEVGVRMALGASTANVLGIVLRHSAAMIAGGVIVGVAGALAAARLLIRFVSGMSPADPATVVGMVTILAAAALLASVLPARRASRIDPMSALRQE